MNNPKKDTKKTITELKKVAGGATAPAPSVKNVGPQLPQAPQNKLTPAPLGYADLNNASAGATAVLFGSVPGGSEPQIPEVFPPPARRITGQSPSMLQLNNVVAGATAPGASYSGSGPALPNKPQMNIGATATPVSVGDLGNVAAGATAPGADIGGSGPALPKKPQFQIGPSSVPVQTDNADSI